MAKNKKKKKSGGVGKWLLLPVLAIAAYFLKDCIPGFGWGGAAGDGTAAPSASSAPSAAPPASASVSGTASATVDAPVTIVVKGDRCDGGDCAEACKVALEKGRPVIVRASGGSHAVVEELDACLRKALKVSIETE